MTNEEKKLIAKYLELKGSRLPDARLMVLAINKMDSNFDKIGETDFDKFLLYAHSIYETQLEHLFDLWLFGNPDNFFKLLGEWLKCRPEK